MKKVIAFLAVIILITAASAVFSAETLLLSDNFNIADNSNYNADLVSRQSGTFAGTSLVDYGGSGTAEIKDGALKLVDKNLYFNRNFRKYTMPGKSLHFSFKMKNAAYYTYVWVGSKGTVFSNGGPGASVQEHSGATYFDCFSSPGVREETVTGNDGGWHQYDIIITSTALGYKTVVIKKDGTEWLNCNAQDAGWGEFYINLHPYTTGAEQYIDDLSVTGDDGGIPDATGYVATGAIDAAGIKILQTNGGYLTNVVSTDYKAYGVSFAANGDLYFTQEYQLGVYKAAYLGNGTWDTPALYASLPSGSNYYYGAFSLSAKTDGTVFVGTYASDEIYKITPDLTVTKIVGAGLSGNRGWEDLKITPEGSSIPGDFWAIYQGINLKNYNADGSDAGFIYTPGEIHLKVVTFAHGKMYSCVNSDTTLYEFDPTNPASKTPYITFAGFQGTTYVYDYINTGAFGPDANGDGYEDFYFKHVTYDGRGSEYIIGPQVIDVYSGAPGLAAGARYLGTYTGGDNMSIFAIDVFPKGTQAPIPVVPVTGVTLNKSTLSLNVWDSKILVATVSPLYAANKAVTWSSSNNAVATVNSSGLVTAGGSAGTSCTITVTTVDGGFTASCTVTINTSIISLLTDSFEAGGAASDLNLNLAARQTGTFAPTALQTSGGGSASITSGGILHLAAPPSADPQLPARMVSFTNDFADFSGVGGYTHYSFKMNSVSDWNYVHIGGLGTECYGGPGLGIELSGGTYYIKSFNAAHSNILVSGSFSGGWHQWDVYFTQQAASRDIVVKLDGTPVYTGTTDSVPNDTYWTSGFLNFHTYIRGGSIEFNDVVITGSKAAIPAPTGYVAAGAAGGIKIYQTNGGYQRGFVSSGEIAGIAFAPNGDMYYTAGNNDKVYKSVYNGYGLWSPGTVYATIPGGGAGYDWAFSLAAKDDGTVFVGTYASDKIYRIDPNLTVTKIVDVGDNAQLGWWDFEISPAGVDGAFWARRQNEGAKNYNADGSPAGFNFATVYDYIRGAAFANGKYYAGGASYTQFFEYDPTDSASGTSFIDFTSEFALGTLSDYVGNAAYGADGNFYFKHFVLDSNNGYICLYTEILAYNGAGAYLGKIQDPNMFQRGMDVWPKGTQTAPPLPTMNYSNNVVIDGDLSDWADTTFTPMNVAYYPSPSVNLDMTNAAYAFKWGAGGTKVYLALKVQDSHPVYNDWYTYWNANDHAEIQLWASSTLSGENDQNICNKFQQYELGLMEDGMGIWSYMCGAGVVPDFANLQYVVTQGIDGWVFYEAAMTPFETFSRLDVNEATVRNLAVDDVIGADAVIASKNNWADFNMIAADGNVGKSANTSKIQKHKLVREGVLGSVELQNYDVTKLGIVGTATITDGTNTEIHNIVLDTVGLYSFTTALRGDCTVIVKCSHWLGKAAVVTVSVTGTGVVELLSVINGDVVDNNEVDFSDINATRDAYGSFPGDETWNARADVDGSGEVDFTDINIVRSKYGEIGD